MNDLWLAVLIIGGFVLLTAIMVIVFAPAPLKDTLDGYEYRWPWWMPKRRKGDHGTRSDRWR